MADWDTVQCRPSDRELDISESCDSANGPAGFQSISDSAEPVERWTATGFILLAVVAVLSASVAVNGESIPPEGTHLICKTVELEGEDELSIEVIQEIIENAIEEAEEEAAD